MGLIATIAAPSSHYSRVRSGRRAALWLPRTAAFVVAVFVSGASAGGLSAQRLEFNGSATNLGQAARPLSSGLTGSLKWRLRDANDPTGELLIGIPLQGSGVTQAAVWSDTLLILSKSLSGDTIAWIGEVRDDQAAGEYLVIGGPFEGQGGKWSLAGSGLSSVISGGTPDLRAVASLRAATTALRLPTGRDNSPTYTPPQSNQRNDEPNDWLIVFGVAVVGALVALGALVAKQSVARSRSASAQVSPGPGQFAIACPTCSQRPISEAQDVWFMYGLVLGARYGKRKLIGCRYCVAEETLRLLSINAVAGWWSIPWGIATPLVIIQNLLALIPNASIANMEETLRAMGIDPDDVRLEQNGLTREQLSLVESASFVLASAIWADGQRSAAEQNRAIEILTQLTGGRLSKQATTEFIQQGRKFERPLSGLSFELRQTLLAIALDIAVADGVLSPPEIAMLHAIAGRLGFNASVVEDMLNDLRGTTRASDEKSRGQRSRRGTSAEDVERALQTLGLRRGATLLEAKQAWRVAMVKYHPDRAGTDKTKHADFTRRAQEINSAYDVVRQSAAAAGV